MPVPSPASFAWIGLVIYVVSVDATLIVYERKGFKRSYTMSTAFRNALSHPWKRWPVIIVWSLLTLHLFDFFLHRAVDDLIARVRGVGSASTRCSWKEPE